MGGSVTWVLAEATPTQQQGSAETTLLEKSLRKNRGSPYQLRVCQYRTRSSGAAAGGKPGLVPNTGSFQTLLGGEPEGRWTHLTGTTRCVSSKVVGPQVRLEQMGPNTQSLTGLQEVFYHISYYQRKCLLWRPEKD